jgi:membrane-associated protein
MIPGFDLIQFSQTAGPVAALLIVAAIIFAENGLLIGFFFPGDSMLFTLGFLIQGTNTVKLNLDINVAIFVLFVAAVAGAYVGYLFGHKVGHRLFRRPNSLLFKQENIQKTKDFYDKYGGKTIIIARFIPIVRTFVPLIAGIAKMDFKVFMLFNILGGIIWTASVTYLGYFLGFWLTKMGIDVDAVILPIILVILVASVAPAIIKVLKDEKQRTAIVNTVKKHIFKK